MPPTQNIKVHRSSEAYMKICIFPVYFCKACMSKFIGVYETYVKARCISSAGIKIDKLLRLKELIFNCPPERRKVG
jgi:hypothetical protein